MHEKTLAVREIYDGRIVKLELVDVELENGTRSNREIIRHKGAVAVLGQFPDGNYVLVKQFRKPVERVVLEVVAGNKEPGEDAELCARRELEEETGYPAISIRHIGAIHPSPGYVDERIEIFFAELSRDRRDVKQDVDECVEAVELSYDQIVQFIRDGKIEDAKTLSTWLLYEKRMLKAES